MTIRVTVLVVVTVTLVVVIKVVASPCRMDSVLVIGGFFTTCSRRGGRSRQYVLMLFASLVRKSCDYPPLVNSYAGCGSMRGTYRCSCVASLEAQGHLGARQPDPTITMKKTLSKLARSEV